MGTVSPKSFFCLILEGLGWQPKANLQDWKFYFQAGDEYLPSIHEAPEPQKEPSPHKKPKQKKDVSPLFFPTSTHLTPFSSPRPRLLQGSHYRNKAMLRIRKQSLCWMSCVLPEIVHSYYLKLQSHNFRGSIWVGLQGEECLAGAWVIPLSHIWDHMFLG